MSTRLWMIVLLIVEVYYNWTFRLLAGFTISTCNTLSYHCLRALRTVLLLFKLSCSSQLISRMKRVCASPIEEELWVWSICQIQSSGGKHFLKRTPVVSQGVATWHCAASLGGDFILIRKGPGRQCVWGWVSIATGSLLHTSSGHTIEDSTLLSNDGQNTAFQWCVTECRAHRNSGYGNFRWGNLISTPSGLFTFLVSFSFYLFSVLNRREEKSASNHHSKA